MASGFLNNAIGRKYYRVLAWIFMFVGGLYLTLFNDLSYVLVVGGVKIVNWILAVFMWFLAWDIFHKNF